MRRCALCLGLFLVNCGGGPAPPPAVPTPVEPARSITITASGVAPKELTVAPGTRVLFVNNDTRRHQMGSDPHPEHSDCPEINAVGLLNPGQSRETGNLVVVRVCGFHDHDNPANSALQGRIVVR